MDNSFNARGEVTGSAGGCLRISDDGALESYYYGVCTYTSAGRLAIAEWKKRFLVLLFLSIASSCLLLTGFAARRMEIACRRLFCDEGTT